MESIVSVKPLLAILAALAGSLLVMISGRRPNVRESWSFIAALVMFGLCAVPAAAHTRSESHSDWQINGTHVETTVAIPELEVKRLGPPGAVITNADVARYMQGKVTVSAGGQACANPGGAKALASTSQFRRVQFEFDCQSAKAMKLGFSGFFELVPSHTDFAQISIAGGEFVEQLFVKDAQVVEAGAESSENALRNAGFLKYVSMGVMHIFTGVDHMSFLVGLVLLSKRTKDLLFVVTGFTIGHSITLALGLALGALHPSRPAHLSELGVLSEDGLLAPSVRLGGGA